MTEKITLEKRHNIKYSNNYDNLKQLKSFLCKFSFSRNLTKNLGAVAQNGSGQLRNDRVQFFAVYLVVERRNGLQSICGCHHVSDL